MVAPPEGGGHWTYYAQAHYSKADAVLNLDVDLDGPPAIHSIYWRFQMHPARKAKK